MPVTRHARAARAPIGVLAVQGDVREHLAALTRLGVDAVPVRRPAELDSVAGLVLPGGESTTMIRLLRSFELLDPLRARLADEMPALGTCAGMILLADRVAGGVPDHDGGQESVGGLDITVRRNAFGRQIDSFEGPVEMRGMDAAVHGVFIRAPWVERVGDGVEVLARLGAGPGADRIVAVRQGRVLATSFHPEVGDDSRVHRLFVDLVTQ